MHLIERYANNTYGIKAPKEQLYGVELEVEDVPIELWPANGTFNPGKYWNMKEDGSLRNHGYEFVSRALDLTTLITALHQFYAWDRRHRFARSIRTSMHVHADMRMYTPYQVLGIAGVYTLVEPLLMHACGSHREENIYCVPFYRANDDLGYVLNALSDADNYFREVRETCKYSALYFEPLHRFGTIEFRMAPVWGTAEEAITWVGAIKKVIEYGLSVESPGAALARYNTVGADAFVTEVFGDTGTWLLDMAGVASAEAMLEEAEVVRQASMLSGAVCRRSVPLQWGPPRLATTTTTLHPNAAELVDLGRALRPRPRRRIAPRHLDLNVRERWATPPPFTATEVLDYDEPDEPDFIDEPDEEERPEPQTELVTELLTTAPTLTMETDGFTEQMAALRRAIERAEVRRRTLG